MKFTFYNNIKSVINFMIILKIKTLEIWCFKKKIESLASCSDEFNED